MKVWRLSNVTDRDLWALTLYRAYNSQEGKKKSGHLLNPGSAKEDSKVAVPRYAFIWTCAILNGRHRRQWSYFAKNRGGKCILDCFENFSQNRVHCRPSCTRLKTGSCMPCFFLITRWVKKMTIIVFKPQHMQWRLIGWWHILWKPSCQQRIHVTGEPVIIVHAMSERRCHFSAQLAY